MPTALQPLPRSFYARPVLQVAKGCIGKMLVHRSAEGTTTGIIVEAEAYRGPHDAAAHSYQGRRTARNEVMYGPAGFAYVFFVYGMHYQFNLVTGSVEQPQAVLIRALQPVHGVELMAGRRAQPPSAVNLTNGPGKLCQAFAIDRQHNAVDLCGPTLFVADGSPLKVERSARIGIDYAGDWVDKPWRFSAAGNAYVSRRPGKRRRS